MRFFSQFCLVLKFVLVLTPLVYLFYFQAMASGVSYAQPQLTQTEILRNFLSSNPQNVITFLAAMINPFVALLLDRTQKSLTAGDYSYTYINVILIIICQILMQNYFYLAAFIFVFYKAVRVYGIKLEVNFVGVIKNNWLGFAILALVTLIVWVKTLTL
jgi:hypothetical protein